MSWVLEEMKIQNGAKWLLKVRQKKPVFCVLTREEGRACVGGSENLSCRAVSWSYILLVGILGKRQAQPGRNRNLGLWLSGMKRLWARQCWSAAGIRTVLYAHLHKSFQDLMLGLGQPGSYRKAGERADKSLVSQASQEREPRVTQGMLESEVAEWWGPVTLLFWIYPKDLESAYNSDAAISVYSSPISNS